MDKKLKILLVNDDGISSPGIVHLAEMAMQLGEVWVAAPLVAVQRHVPEADDIPAA
ncbi:MAG: 5'/3'-nucleotidase SurE [Oscillospiraceae bacterium]